MAPRRKLKKKSPINTELVVLQNLTAKLMGYKIKMEDHVYKNILITKSVALGYLKEIHTFVGHFKNDARTLQVINKLNCQLKLIINEEESTNENISDKDVDEESIDLENLSKNLTISEPINVQIDNLRENQNDNNICSDSQIISNNLNTLIKNDSFNNKNINRSDSEDSESILNDLGNEVRDTILFHEDIDMFENSQPSQSTIIDILPENTKTNSEKYPIVDLTKDSVQSDETFKDNTKSSTNLDMFGNSQPIQRFTNDIVATKTQNNRPKNTVVALTENFNQHQKEKNKDNTRSLKTNIDMFDNSQSTQENKNNIHITQNILHNNQFNDYTEENFNGKRCCFDAKLDKDRVNTKVIITEFQDSQSILQDYNESQDTHKNKAKNSQKPILKKVKETNNTTVAQTKITSFLSPERYNLNEIKNSVVLKNDNSNLRNYINNMNAVKSTNNSIKKRTKKRAASATIVKNTIKNVDSATINDIPTTQNFSQNNQFNEYTEYYDKSQQESFKGKRGFDAELDKDKINKKVIVSEFHDSQSILRDYNESQDIFLKHKNKAENPIIQFSNIQANSLQNTQKSILKKGNETNNTKIAQTKITSFLSPERYNLNEIKNTVVLKNDSIFKKSINSIKAVKQTNNTIKRRTKKRASSAANIKNTKNNVDFKQSEKAAFKSKPLTNECSWIRDIKYVREVNVDEYFENTVPEEFWRDSSLLPGLCEEDFNI